MCPLAVVLIVVVVLSCCLGLVAIFCLNFGWGISVVSCCFVVIVLFSWVVFSGCLFLLSSFVAFL